MDEDTFKAYLLFWGGNLIIIVDTLTQKKSPKASPVTEPQVLTQSLVGLGSSACMKFERGGKALGTISRFSRSNTCRLAAVELRKNLSKTVFVPHWKPIWMPDTAAPNAASFSNLEAQALQPKTRLHAPRIGNLLGVWAVARIGQ